MAAKQKFGAKESADPKTKYGKYIVFKSYDNPFHPTTDPKAYSMFLDSRGVKDGFYFSGGMMLPFKPAPGKGTHPAWSRHYHDYMEYLAFLGTNPDDESDLGGEAYVTIEDEKFTFNKTCVVTIPAKTWHSPIGFNFIDRPILFYSASPAPILYQHVKRDPKNPSLKSDMIILED